MKEIIRQIISGIGDDPSRPGLIDTPERIEKMYKELFRGYLTPPPVITTFSNGGDGLAYDEMIIDEGRFYSFCEHHMMPFFGTYYFAYIPSPTGNILGLSKVARVVDYFSARLQIQERLTKDICEYIGKSLGEPAPIGIALVMKGEHLCKTMRGAKKQGFMTTTHLSGAFKDDVKVRSEFLSSIKI